MLCMCVCVYVCVQRNLKEEGHGGTGLWWSNRGVSKFTKLFYICYFCGINFVIIFRATIIFRDMNYFRHCYNLNLFVFYNST